MIIVLAFVFGLIIGSFLNVVIWRIPAGEKLTGRSHCVKCKRTLGALDLIPILSYVFLAGKCRGCGKKISKRYPIIELITAILFAYSAFFFWQDSFLSFIILSKACFVLAVLLVVFVIDYEHFLIFDNVLITGSAGVLLFNLLLDFLLMSEAPWLHGNFLTSILAGILAASPFFLLWLVSKGEWLGFGDVKLAVFLGIALGWPGVFVGLFIGILTGGIFGTFLLLIGAKGLKSKLPFGTFLAIGAAIALFYARPLLDWYLTFTGLK